MEGYYDASWRAKHLVNDGWCVNNVACQGIWWCSTTGLMRATAIGTTMWLANFYIHAYVTYPVLSFIDRQYPSKYHNEQGRFWMAWHIQSVMHSSILVTMVSGPMLRMYQLSGETALAQFSLASEAMPESVLEDMVRLGNAPSVFWCFLLADMLIVSIHKIGSWDNLIHHVIFISFCIIVTYGCFAAYLAGVMMLMEISTVFLNYFSFFRNRTGFGAESLSVVASFLAFAVTFLFFRLVLFTRIAVAFMHSAYVDRVYGTAPPQIIVLICIGLIAACVLQFYWAAIIFSKALRQAAPSVADTILGKKEKEK